MRHRILSKPKIENKRNGEQALQATSKKKSMSTSYLVDQENEMRMMEDD
jgi:hypothetical protein